MPITSDKQGMRSRATKETCVSALEEMNGHRVAHLATADRRGQPLVVPLCFACLGEVIYSVVDEKPKRVTASRLRRLRNIEENSKVAVLADHYEEDWRRLCYILVEGRARVLRSGREYSAALRLLRNKYSQYRKMRLEDKPVIKISSRRVVRWKAR